MIAGAVSVGYQPQIEADFITQDDRSGSTAAVGALPAIGLLAGAERTNSVGMRTLGLGRSAARKPVRGSRLMLKQAMSPSRVGDPPE